MKVKRLISYNLDVEVPFLQSVADELEWKFVKITESGNISIAHGFGCYG